MNATALHHTSRGESTLHAGQVRQKRCVHCREMTVLGYYIMVILVFLSDEGVICGLFTLS